MNSPNKDTLIQSGKVSLHGRQVIAKVMLNVSKIKMNDQELNMFVYDTWNITTTTSNTKY